MTCPHVDQLPPEPDVDTEQGCVDCRAAGDDVWAHLRACLSCGHVACCDSSPNRHAEAHHAQTGHPVIRSAEPEEDWRWCYVDERLV